jgi:ribosomal protein L11 methylase PrmA
MIFKPKKKDKFAAWLEKNQGGSFTQFYAESVLDALSGERKHASLGPKLAEGSEDHARKRFDELIAQGIRPGDTVVDYGCGTLRLGALFIAYLDADRYIGLDIDDRIIAAGREQLPADLVEAKRPTLEVISPESLARALARKPQWIFSNGVLPHVPPEHLAEYFTNLSRFVLAGATGIFSGKARAKREKLSAKSWMHDAAQLQEVVEACGMQLERLRQGLWKLPARASS